ncbi:NAD-dependent epimerase/dehydratase family protein [Rhodovibrio salinarum]|uniref:NAD(P)-dependent oxidoreductase n=1 Tax=Rhodovibrio salinarum TaxID=1087 RepID=A0A934UYV6_9PROT|nr:NAD(P)-dependent oxidoreductase [Rhodovibrio salinarum]MBK1695725.1 NAD(P)-dependent oxidoreductase [Rhodovibrio salinarum]
MLSKLLMTGAAGGVGAALRPLLAEFATSVVLSDVTEITDLAAHESFQLCDLGDSGAVAALFDGGVDGVIHLGGVSVEKTFDLILNANLVGAYNLFEAARHHGQPRIIFASSNHTVGYYRRDEQLDNTVLPKPDSLYGVSKVFGESLASMYFNKFGQECLSVRIGSCFPKPADPRMLATWLAVEDLADLCACAFAAPRLGHTIVYGASDNAESWWDNRNADFLGWRPKHSSAKWRAEVLASASRQDARDPAVIYQGGGFVAAGHPSDKS